MSDYVLEMKNISKTFPGVKALDNVSLAVKPGEVHAVMGENGAGKSTLMKIIMGIYTADSGEMLVEGQTIVNRNPQEAMENGIAMIHQELNPVLDMRVYENIFMGREIRTKFGTYDKKMMIAETKRLLEEIEIDIPATCVMRGLSVAQCQLIEIVKAISIHARIVVMDEPTSAITDKEIDILFNQINSLKAKGVAIIYISHKIDEIFRISDRISVYRDGCYIGTDESANLDHNQLIKMMVGREITDIYPKTEYPIGDVVMEVKNLSMGNKVDHVSFKLHQGEILGIVGLVGAGRSELVETIFGVRKKTAGKISIRGKVFNGKNPEDGINAKIALITEDRKLTGLNLVASVKENITLASLRRVSTAGVLSTKEETHYSEKYIDALKIKTSSKDTLTGCLSGGNQQKVVLAKWLLTEPDIIIMDEPTRGIDVGAKRDIYLLMGEFAKQGKAVIMISSEIPEIMGVSDRVIVMAEGKITGELKRSEFSQERIMEFASNIKGGAAC
ncbi:MAG: sugar ABC transporter ATP-binding protein [Christensenellales bacterium]